MSRLFTGSLSKFSLPYCVLVPATSLYAGTLLFTELMETHETPSGFVAPLKYVSPYLVTVLMHLVLMIV